MFSNLPYKAQSSQVPSLLADKSYLAFPFFTFTFNNSVRFPIASLSNENRVFYPLLLQKRNLPLVSNKKNNGRIFLVQSSLPYNEANTRRSATIRKSNQVWKVNSNLGLPGYLGQHLERDINGINKNQLGLETIKGGNKISFR